MDNLLAYIYVYVYYVRIADKQYNNMKVDYMKPSSWRKVKITNNTIRTLKNGKIIPTWSAMARKAKKI